MSNQQGSRRNWQVLPAQDEDGTYDDAYDRERALELLANLEGTLYEIGGVVHIGTDRVKVDEVAGQPIYVTERLIVQWQAFAPGRDAAPQPAPEVETVPANLEEPVET